MSTRAKPGCCQGLTDHAHQMIFHAGETPGHETGVQCHRHCQGMKRFGINPMRLRFGHKTFVRGRAGLPLGQAIYLIVMDQHNDIEVSPDGRQKMIAALPVVAAVAAFHDNRYLYGWPNGSRWPPAASVHVSH